MDQKKIGFLIKKIRLDNNLNQKEFAYKYNVSFIFFDCYCITTGNTAFY